MKTKIVLCPLGALAFDEKNKLVEKVLFPKKPQIVAKALLNDEAGKITDEVATLVSLLQNVGYDTFVFQSADLARKVQETMGVKVDFAKPFKISEVLRSNIEKFAVESGFSADTEEFSLWTHKVSMELAKLRVKGAVEKRDLVIAQAIQTLDDLDKTINLLMGRLREWYGIHFPELDRLVEKHETYVRLVLKLGAREDFSPERLKKEGIPESKAEVIAKVAETSMGADIGEADLKQIQALCENLTRLYELRQTMEDYLDKGMEEVAPNTKAIVGSLLGARLIAISGGLANLARRPASTIQVLGAEKALFRSLKSGARPPKHGIVFQHTLLHEAKKWQRGKIARALAGKLAIAVRADAFGDRYIGDELKADLEKRIEEIREKYGEPPEVPERKLRHEKKWRKKKRAGKS